MCDVVHCAGKTGKHVLSVCEKQWARLGLYKDDVVAGTGDGGGENEGAAGVHSILEKHSNGTYVRRRCLAHLPWRVADQGLAEMDSDGQDQLKKLKAISSYLHESGTWNRMKAISVLPVESGGIAMFIDGSIPYSDFFSKAPPKNMDERPDTSAALLEWLMDRSYQLSRLCKADSESRKLAGQQNLLAIASLADTTDIIFRRVAYIAIKKSMYMYYYVQSHENVSMSTSWEDLVSRAKNILTSPLLTAEVMKMLKLEPADIDAAFGHGADVHWIQAAVQFTPGVSQLEKDSVLDKARQFVNKLIFRMQSHLHLVAANIYRCPWLAARLLSLS